MPYLRIKQPDCELTMLDIAEIVAWGIELIGGEHCLGVMLRNGNGVAAHYGTFDECHALLNRITKKLKLEIIDI